MAEEKPRNWPARVEASLTELERIRSELDTLFHRFGPVYARSLSDALPTTRVSEQADFFVVEIDLQGMEQHEIEVSASGNSLTVGVNLEIRRVDVDETSRRQSTKKESAQRTVQLPAEIDPEGMEAKCAAGKLTVRLPKVRRSAGRRITIRPQGEGGGS